MTAPSQHLRDLREATTRRRLDLARLLREDPTTTNVSLAKSLNVSRNTIAEDRKAIMEQMTKSTLNETELLRAEMVKKLDGLVAEVEKHRKDGKLSLSAIDQMLSITKALVELTGCRKPVNEKLQVTHRAPIQFQTVIVPTRQIDKSKPPSPNHEWSEKDKGWVLKQPPFVDAELITEPHALGAGDEQR